MKRLGVHASKHVRFASRGTTAESKKSGEGDCAQETCLFSSVEKGRLVARTPRSRRQADSRNQSSRQDAGRGSGAAGRVYTAALLAYSAAHRRPQRSQATCRRQGAALYAVAARCCGGSAVAALGAVVRRYGGPQRQPGSTAHFSGFHRQFSIPSCGPPLLPVQAAVCRHRSRKPTPPATMPQKPTQPSLTQPSSRLQWMVSGA